MPPAVIAIASAAATSFGVGGLVGATSVFGLSAMGSFLVRAGVGLALNALARTSNTGSPVSGGYKITANGSNLDHQIIYGRTKVAGVRVFDHVSGTDNQYLHRIIAFAGHEIDSFDEIWINDTKVNTVDASGYVTSIIDEDGATDNDRYDSTVDPSLIRIKEHLGDTAQTVDTDLDSELAVWTTDHRLRGVAYLYLRFKYSQGAFPDGVPEVTAVIKGKKVYDTRTATTAWSENPALCIRDYLISDYGLNAPTSEIDDTLVSAAANVCETTRASIDQFTCNGAFTTSSAPVDVLEGLLSSMAGSMWYAQGTWRMKPGYWTASVLSLTDDDLRSGVTISTRNSRRDNFNTVRGAFVGEENNWQATSFKEVTNAGYITVDGGETSSIDINLPFTSNHKTARQIASIMLRSNREQIRISANFGLRAFAVEVGDTIDLTLDRMGWSAKTFEVVNWSFSVTDDMTIEVQLDLKETSSAVFTTDAAASTFETNNSTLPKPRVTVAPTGLGYTLEEEDEFDNKVRFDADLDWTACADEFVTKYEVQWKRSSVSNYRSVRTDETFHKLDNLKANVTYNVRVRGINIYGSKGPWATLSVVTTQSAGYESDVTISGLAQTSTSAVLSDGRLRCSAKFSWNNVANVYLDRYKLAWRLASETEWNYMTVEPTTGATSDAKVDSLSEGETTWVRVRAITSIGYRGPWSTILAFTPTGDTTAPSAPTSVTGFGISEGVQLFWTNPGAGDFSFNQIWSNSTNTTVGATRVGRTAGETFTLSNLLRGTNDYYFIRSCDRAGNFSSYTSGVRVKAVGKTDVNNLVPDDDFLNEEAWTGTTPTGFELATANAAGANSEGKMTWVGTLPVTSLVRSESRSFKVRPAQTLFCSGQVSANGGDASVGMGIRFYERDGTAVSNTTFYTFTLTADSAVRTGSGTVTVPALAYYAVFDWRLNSCTSNVKFYGSAVYRKAKTDDIEDAAVKRVNIEDEAVTQKDLTTVAGPLSLSTTLATIMPTIGNGVSVGTVAPTVCLRRYISFEGKKVGAGNLEVNLDVRIQDYDPGSFSSWNTVQSWVISDTSYSIKTDTSNLSGPFENAEYRLQARVTSASATSCIKNIYFTVEEPKK